MEEDQIEEGGHGVGNLMDSKTSHLDDILQEKLEKAYHKETSHFALAEIAKISQDHSAVDLAYSAHRVPPEVRLLIYRNLTSVEAKVTFMINTDSSTRVQVFRQISDLDTKDLIEQMPSDEAADVLDCISERRFRRVMDLLDVDKAKRVREIKQQARNTAGRLMTNEFFGFKPDVTLGEVASYIRNHPGIDFTRRIFIVDDAGKLLGYVPIRTLIVNASTLPLKQVMRPVEHMVTAESSREECVDLVERYTISALPVVDEEERLIGVVTYEDVVEAMEDIADETIASIAGTAEDVSEHEPMWKRFFARAPWLLVTLFAGLVNGSVMSAFQGYGGGILTFVIFFVPLVTGMSGNVGIQSSTVLVRSMATGILSEGTKVAAMVKEVVLGLTSGVVFGVLTGILVYALDFLGISHLEISPLLVGSIVGVGLFGACFVGSLLGVLSPIFFARVGVDPAIASGPIITALNDFLSMSIYFLIALGLGSIFF